MFTRKTADTPWVRKKTAAPSAQLTDREYMFALSPRSNFMLPVKNLNHPYPILLLLEISTEAPTLVPILVCLFVTVYLLKYI